jgi:hypothetical protein
VYAKKPDPKVAEKPNARSGVFKQQRFIGMEV